MHYTILYYTRNTMLYYIILYYKILCFTTLCYIEIFYSIYTKVPSYTIISYIRKRCDQHAPQTSHQRLPILPPKHTRRQEQDPDLQEDQLSLTLGAASAIGGT